MPRGAKVGLPDGRSTQITPICSWAHILRRAARWLAASALEGGRASFLSGSALALAASPLIYADEPFPRVIYNKEAP